MTDLLGEKVSERIPRGTIPRWVELYGFSERQIKKWWAMGREVGEVPPLDQPELFELWAEKHMGKITKRLADSIYRAKGGESASSSPAPAAPMEMPEVREDELGMEAQLRYYRMEFVTLQKLREKALMDQDFPRAKQYFAEGKEMSAEIRQLEKALPAALEHAGTYQRTAEIRQEVGKMLAYLKRSLITRGSKAGPKLRATTNDADTAAVWKSEIEAIFGECVDERFGLP